jgi:hypothetical protein
VGRGVSVSEIRQIIRAQFWTGSTALIVLLAAIFVESSFRSARNGYGFGALFFYWCNAPIVLFVLLYVMIAILKTRSAMPLLLMLGGIGVIVISLTLFPALSNEERHFLAYESEYEYAVARARSGDSLRGLCPGRETVAGCVWIFDRGHELLFVAFDPLSDYSDRQIVYAESDDETWCERGDGFRVDLPAPNWYVCIPDWP